MTADHDGDPSQPLTTPSSPQLGHHHSIDAGTSRRTTSINPAHGRRSGRRVHRIEVTVGFPTGLVVPASTKPARCSAIRRADVGESSGMSRKCRRSETTPAGAYGGRTTAASTPTNLGAARSDQGARRALPMSPNDTSGRPARQPLILVLPAET